jgi:hypothetical protein
MLTVVRVIPATTVATLRLNVSTTLALSLVTPVAVRLATTTWMALVLILTNVKIIVAMMILTILPLVLTSVLLELAIPAPAATKNGWILMESALNSTSNAVAAKSQKLMVILCILITTVVPTLLKSLVQVKLNTWSLVEAAEAVLTWEEEAVPVVM